MTVPKKTDVIKGMIKMGDGKGMQKVTYMHF